MTQDVVPAGSVFALEVSEYHEFEPDEFSSTEPDRQRLPERPFNKMERTSDYVFHLPEERDDDSPYPWDDQKWQGDWMFNKGGIGKSEAYFWFIAMTHPERITDTRTVYKAPRDLRRIRHVDADRFDTAEARERMETWFELVQKRHGPMRWFSYAYLPRLLRPLIPQHEILDLVFDLVPAGEVRHYFAHFVMPEDDEARARLVERARAHLDALDYTDHDAIYTGIRLLERIPIDDETERLVDAVEAHPDTTPTMIRDAVNLLEDPKRFAAMFDRMSSYQLTPEQIPYVFGKGSYDVVGPLLERVHRADASFQMAAIKDLVRIHTPKAVPGFVALYDDSAVAPMAHGWLTGEGANAVKGLIDMALGRTKRTHIAQRLLREYRDRGHRATIERLAEQLSDTMRARLLGEILEGGIGMRTELPASEWPDWMAERLARKRPSKRLPDYVDAENLPSLVSRDGEHILPQTVVNGVINRIIGSRPDSVDDLIPKLRDFLSPHSRDAFAWHIFERWRENGCEAREKFCLWSLGFLGTDESGAKLFPYLDEWTTERRYYRATWALDVYRTLGTDAALMMLHRASQRAKSKALRAHADEMLDTIASDRDLSRAQLDDRIVPDCGLGERGQRVFDFGPRQLTATLDADLKPHVEDDKGKVRPSLPPMRKSDDPALVARAQAEWKVFTQQVREAVKVQCTRLEQAMIAERRWSGKDFKQLVIDHPLMALLARKILWGTYEREAGLTRILRVTAERELVGVEDEVVEIGDRDRVGIIHPLELDEEAHKRWGSIFGDYEVQPLFAQLDRPVFTLDADEREATNFDRFGGAHVEAIRLRSRLQSRGWNIEVVEDGQIFSFGKPFPRHSVHARVEITPGMSTNWNERQEEQQLDAVLFASGPRNSNGLKLGEVPELIVSEVALDLQEIVDKS